MATQNIIRISVDTSSTAFELGAGPVLEEEGRPSGGGGGSPATIRQRIYDSSLAQYVYYSDTAVTTSPAAGVTVPNHTNNLVTATHEII